MIHEKNSISILNNRIAVESFGSGLLSPLHLKLFSLFPKIVKIARRAKSPILTVLEKGFLLKGQSSLS